MPLPRRSSSSADVELHQPVLDRLTRLIHRGQRAGEFDRDASPGWLIAATVALGHAAWAEVAAGRMSADAAAAAVRTGILRVYGAAPRTRDVGG